MGLRKVRVYKREPLPNTAKLIRVLDYVGYFHEFGVLHEEFEGGAGNYTTAIVEKLDGTIDEVSDISYIEFVTPYGDTTKKKEE